MKPVLCVANAVPPMAGDATRHPDVACCLPGFGCEATVLVSSRG